MISSGCCSFLKALKTNLFGKKSGLILILTFFSTSLHAQFPSLFNQTEWFSSENQLKSSEIETVETFSIFDFDSIEAEQIQLRKDTVPKPRVVLMQSLTIPGWGQITNGQLWKVPLVYGALIGVGYYSYWLHTQYVDFRAAYYNSFAATNPAYADLKFGATPERLVGAPQTALKSFRNYYRNERDFMILMFGLTYALNVVDAYIFAQLKDFDVSDDLSLQAKPIQIEGISKPSLTLTFRF